MSITKTIITIKKLESNFKSKQKQYDNKFKSYDEIRFIKDKSSDDGIAEIHKNGQLLIRFRYFIAGAFNFYNSIWYWGHNIQLVDKNLTKKTIKVKQFAADIKKNYSKYNSVEADQLYFITNNDNFYTSNKNILLPIKLIMFLTNGLWFIPICYGKDGNILLQGCSSDNLSIKRMDYLIITKIISHG